MTGDSDRPEDAAPPAVPVVSLSFGYVSRGAGRSGEPVLLPLHQVTGPDPDGRYQRYLASGLGSMTRTVAACDLLLSLLEPVERGDEPSAGYEGEQVEITFTAAGAQIDITVEEAWTGQPEGRFGLDQVRAVIEAKRRFLAPPPSTDSVVELQLPVIPLH